MFMLKKIRPFTSFISFFQFAVVILHNEQSIEIYGNYLPDP